MDALFSSDGTGGCAATRSMFSDSMERAGRVGDFQWRFLSGSRGASTAWTSEKSPEGSVHETVYSNKVVSALGVRSDQPPLSMGEVYTSDFAQTGLICWVHSSSQVRGTLSNIASQRHHPGPSIKQCSTK